MSLLCTRLVLTFWERLAFHSSNVIIVAAAADAMLSVRARALNDLHLFCSFKTEQKTRESLSERRFKRMDEIQHLDARLLRALATARHHGRYLMDGRLINYYIYESSSYEEQLTTTCATTFFVVAIRRTPRGRWQPRQRRAAQRRAWSPPAPTRRRGRHSTHVRLVGPRGLLAPGDGGVVYPDVLVVLGYLPRH